VTDLTFKETRKRFLVCVAGCSLIQANTNGGGVAVRKSRNGGTLALGADGELWHVATKDPKELTE
jgi:hypothetical protein